MKKNLSCLLLILTYLAFGGVSAEAAEMIYEPGGERYFMFGTLNGDFYGDGSGVRVEILGTPLWGEEYDEIARVLIARGDLYVLNYILRSAPEPPRPIEEHILDASTFESKIRYFKKCDIDGDGIPEVFFASSPGGSGPPGMEINVISLKDGAIREVFPTAGEDFEWPDIYAKMEPCFKIRLTAEYVEDSVYNVPRAEAVIDLKGHPEKIDEYTDEWKIFSPTGDPLENVNYHPDTDGKFPWFDAGDIDGDGRDEIYGATWIVGAGMYDTIANLNIAFKWTDKEWKIAAMSVSDVDRPLAGIPGVDYDSFLYPARW